MLALTRAHAAPNHSSPTSSWMSANLRGGGPCSSTACARPSLATHVPQCSLTRGRTCVMQDQADGLRVRQPVGQEAAAAAPAGPHDHLHRHPGVHGARGKAVCGGQPLSGMQCLHKASTHTTFPNQFPHASGSLPVDLACCASCRFWKARSTPPTPTAP